MNEPAARSMKTGSRPTARIARTGLFTPPGRYRKASANNSRLFLSSTLDSRSHGPLRAGSLRPVLTQSSIL